MFFKHALRLIKNVHFGNLIYDFIFIIKINCDALFRHNGT